MSSLLDGAADGTITAPNLSKPWGPVNATAPSTVGQHTINVTDAETGAKASATFNVIIPTLGESPSGATVTPASGGAIVLVTGSQTVRNAFQAPGEDGRYFSLPLQTTANIITSGAMVTALRQGTPNVQQNGIPWVVGGSGDPDCTVSDGTTTTTVKIPVGTTAGGASVGGAVYISPGGGSFSTGGNTYSIDASDNAKENGAPMNDGAGTGQMALYQGVVYGQDATSKNWFIWNGSAFTPAGSPPPAPGAGGSGLSSLGGADSTRPYKGWTANGVLIDGSASNATKAGSIITCTAMQVYDLTGPVMEDATTGLTNIAAEDNAIGNLTEFELLAAVAGSTYVPPHTVACSLDLTQINSGASTLPTQTQLNAIASAITNTVNTEVPGGELFGGPGTAQPLTFLPGDVVIADAPNVQATGVRGALTDKDGTVWTLVADVSFQTNPPAWWWGGIKRNGAILPRTDNGTDGYGGYFIALRLLNNGHVWVEEAKFGGWWDLTAANETTTTATATVDFDDFTRPGLGPQPGPGPNNTSGVATAAPAWPANSVPSGGTGPIPIGATICIPHTVSKPNGQSRGYNLLFDIMRQNGLYVRGINSTGAASIGAAPASTATKALVTDMNASFASVMGLAGILAFDGSSGSQTGPSTAKGMIGGVRADAFAAPALIDLSDTGGTPSVPNTFGAWYATGQGIFYNIATNGGAIAGTTESATITSGAKIAFNGVADGATSNVVELFYWNHVLYQKNAAGNWFSGHNGTYTAVAVSASGTPVTDGTGIILDSAGDLVTLQNGKVTFTGVQDNTTANVTTVLWFNGQLYQENSSGAWWVGTKGSWGNQLAGGDPRNAITPPPGANFSISNSIITAPNGQRWFGKGVDVAPWGRPIYQAVTNGTKPLTTSLPGITFLQIYIANDEGYNVDTGLFPIIDALTAAGIVVCLHSCNSNFVNSVPTGANLTAECNMFAGYATHYIGNPYVTFCTDNEPHDENVGFGAVTAEHLAVYNAIRGTGNNNLIGLSVPNPGNNMNAANYAQMFNVYWEQHYYPFEDGIGGFGYITSFQPLSSLPSRDGIMPIIIGEFGSSTSGNTASGIDGPGLPSHLMSQPRYTDIGNGMILNGWAEWGIATSGEFDQIFGQNNATGTLNSYGQELAGFIASA